jgi:hypothetical protein
VVSHAYVSTPVGSARYLVLLIFFVLMILQRRDPGDRPIISNFVMWMSCLLTDAPDLDETDASVAYTTTVPPDAPSTGSTPVPYHDPGNKPAMVYWLLTIWIARIRIARIVGSVETSVIQLFSHLFVYEQPTVLSFSFILGLWIFVSNTPYVQKR